MFDLASQLRTQGISDFEQVREIFGPHATADQAARAESELEAMGVTAATILRFRKP